MKQGKRHSERYQNTCLIDSLRAMGLKVPYESDGPFWVLRDGNKLVAPLGHLLCN